MIREGLFALALVSAPSAAHAQVLPLQLERWADQCNNAAREYSLEAAERACTSIIRSDNAASGARAFAYRQRGAIRLERGDRVRALADFDSAIEHNSHFAVAFISRAAVFEDQRDYDRAVADYDQVLRIAPEFAAAYNARCWLKALSGRDLSAARADCDQAIAMGVGSGAYDTRGLLNLRDGNFEAAWTDYDEAVRGRGGAHSLYGRGIAAARLGRASDAQADLSEASAVDQTVVSVYAGYGIAP